MQYIVGTLFTVRPPYWQRAETRVDGERKRRRICVDSINGSANETREVQLRMCPQSLKRPKRKLATADSCCAGGTIQTVKPRFGE